MAVRANPLVTGEYYHIFNRSIAGYKIFNGNADSRRFLDGLIYYLSPIPNLKLSRFLELINKKKQKIFSERQGNLVEIVAYCIMPTHFHLVLKQNSDLGITNYLFNLQNSYSHYFNIKYKRKGPLWESKFKNVRVESDEQLLHLTRYIHLNPTSAELVIKPQDWQWSSYNEYIKEEKGICRYKEIINISPKEYEGFVLDRKNYQRKLNKIKAILMDNYTG